MSTSSPGAWKNQPAGSLDPDGSGPLWQRGVDPGRPVHPRKKRGPRLLIALLLLLVFSALLIWVSLWLQPAKGTAVVILYAGYEDVLAVPHNVYGRNGAEALAQFANANPGRSTYWSTGTLQMNQKPRLLNNVEEWSQDLSKVREKTLLLYFAVHGGADGQGAYLLPQRSMAPDEFKTGDPARNFLRLEAVLDRLKEAVPHDRHVVLVLDCTQMTSSIPLGMLHNNFVSELKKLEDKILDNPNLVVVTSTDVDQRSWVCEEFGKTIFTHYLIEGLKGAADGADSEKHERNGRINAYELHKYVSNKVADWSRRNREAEQTPVLWPRKDHVGEKRAKGIHLTVAPKGYVEPLPTVPPAFVAPKSLVEAWKLRDRLAVQTPPPAAYAPHLWRLYQDMLLRYDDLLRVGETRVASSIATRLRDIEQSLQFNQKLDLEAVGGSLAMPALAYPWGPADKQATDALNRLWDAQPKDLPLEWAMLQKQIASADKTGRELFRLKLCELTLERFTENPGQNLDKTTQVLYLLDNPLLPRPAEAHYLLMMDRDLARPPSSKQGAPLLPAKYFQLAMEVRLRAERAALGLKDSHEIPVAGAYPYAEQVAPWIQESVIQADALRLKGQDLLLATDEVNWERGRAFLLEADKKYKIAQADGSRVQWALNVRDRVLPVLPYYARWLAARVMLAPEVAPADEGTLRRQVAELWTEVHSLNQMLDRKTLSGLSGSQLSLKRAQALQSLSETTARIQRLFDGIRLGFVDYCKDIDNLDDPRAAWHSVDQALLVVPDNWATRIKLVERRSQLGRALFTASLQPEPAGASPATPGKDQVDRLKHVAKWQGQLALAEFGKDFVDETGGAKRLPYDQLLVFLDQLRVAPDWRQSLTVAGAEIAARWRELPPAVARYLAVAAKKDAALNLSTADRLARLADGAESEQFKENPARAYRQRLVQDVLLWQAERSAQEHWAAVDPAEEPYFRKAGMVFLKGAKGHEGYKKVERLLAEDAKLTVSLVKAPGYKPGGPAVPVLQWTSEDAFPLQFKVSPAAESVGAGGYSVAWVDTTEGVELLGLDAGQRLVQGQSGGADSGLLCTLRTKLIRAGEADAPPMPRPVDAKVYLHGLFRGHRLDYETKVVIHPVAQTIWTSHPAPPTASVALRAPREVHQELGASRGSVAVVLDCTGSMGPQKGQPVENSKWHEAVDALAQVLRKIPRGAQVSVWVFGEAIGPEKTVTNPADSIEQLLTPTPWNPEDNEKIDELVAKAKGLEPWNLSPILRAMYTAAKKDLASAPGFKTLVVITDGMDNCFENDKALNGGKKDTRQFILENFADIQVNLIGFKLVPSEEKQVRKQFAALEELPKKSQFWMVNESFELVSRIQKIIPQKLRYSITDEDDLPLRGAAENLDVSQNGRDDQWILGGLAPGGYKLRLGGTKDIRQGIALSRGDLLLLELAPDARGRQALRRVIYSESDFPGAVGKDREGWRLAVLQNQRVQDQGLEMLMTLEKEQESQLAALQVVKPAKVWFEVTPPGDAGSSFVSRWQYQPGFPAPAWGLDVPTWPSTATGKSPARPVVRAWWAADRLLPPAAVLDRDLDFRNLQMLTGRTLRVDEQEVTIESVTVEDHLIETEPGVRGAVGQLKTAPCLVVRVAHSRNYPVWVQLRGIEAAGQEHRYYTSAGKYAAIFWPVVADQAETVLAGLDVYSVNAFKRDAEANKCMLELKNLYEPLATDIRPQQPVSGFTQPTIERMPPATDPPPPVELPQPKKLDAPKAGKDLPAQVPNPFVPPTAPSIEALPVPQGFLPPAMGKS
jgi:hypothetical protein